MQGEAKRAGIRELLLTRRGVVFVESSGGPQSDAVIRALELELAAIGHVCSERLRARLQRAETSELIAWREWVVAALLARIGGDRKHEPLFRRFPQGVPDDTAALWWEKVLVHFLQAEGQPCLTCRRIGTTHVLDPCRHVVCDRCFDGANYSACPVCEHHVDRSAPFFKAAPQCSAAPEPVTFNLLDLGNSLADEARLLCVSLCERKQTLAPVDRDALITLVKEHGTAVVAWLPPQIPVRENVAAVFGTLLGECIPDEVLPQAKRFMKTATDVLRLLAVMSGTDGSLQAETVFKSIAELKGRAHFWNRISNLLGAEAAAERRRYVRIPMRLNRFKMVKLPRALRRALLALLDGMNADALVEDMLRHRSYWVWSGEFLHPHEYASRFPNVARAFQIVRGQAPDGTPAPRFRTWYSRLEEAVIARDADAMLQILQERPGEFLRRFDLVLRVANSDDSRERVLKMLESNLGNFATPVLLTVRSHLPSRTRPAEVRVYWPKGRVARSVSGPDDRAPLAPDSLRTACQIIERELLQRFSQKPSFVEGLVDESLADIMVPFNERTASRSAVQLPRGSRIPVEPAKCVRLFLHWCQPQKADRASDLDLSVAFYDAAWKYLGVCSYYELTTRTVSGKVIARSAGDLRDAPWPHGASEFVDLDRDAAIVAGVRYAAMVVTNYSGATFGELEHAFAGLMLRDRPEGSHFDPRTVELKFALDGDHGVFLPLVLDLHAGALHWLDVQSRGMFEMNSVESAKNAIAKICPEQMGYFSSGVRTSMRDLALIHVAARCQRVFLRAKDGVLTGFLRRDDESIETFYGRIVRREADVVPPGGAMPRVAPQMVFLLRGDIDVPEGSATYALFREKLTPTLAASDLLS